MTPLCGITSPQIGIAAVKVLEAAGFEVALPTGRMCCGRPAFSQGNLDEVMRLGHHNLALLNQDVDSAPILFLEPSCYSMFVEDYRELTLEGAEQVAKRCFLFEQFLEELLSHEPEALKFKVKAGNMVIHAHCHTKALTNPGHLRRLAERLPERNVTLLDTGCCGMAGASACSNPNTNCRSRWPNRSRRKSGHSRSGPRWSPPAPVAAIKSSTWRPSAPATWPRCWPMRWHKPQQLSRKRPSLSP